MADDFAKVAATDYQTLGDFNNRHYFLTVVEAGSPRSRYRQNCLFLRPLSLACRCPSSLCVFTWSSLCVCPYPVDTSYVGRGPILMISPNLHYLLRDQISKSSHIRMYWKLGLPHMNLWGTQFNLLGEEISGVIWPRKLTEQKGLHGFIRVLW